MQHLELLTEIFNIGNTRRAQTVTESSKEFSGKENTNSGGRTDFKYGNK
jgi:hypothetical protein